MSFISPFDMTTKDWNPGQPEDTNTELLERWLPNHLDFRLKRTTSYDKDYNNYDLFPAFNERRDHSNPKYIPTNESPENPLLGLSQQEYQAFIHYQQAHAIPGRFCVDSEAGRSALLNANDSISLHPKFQTTYQEYGRYPHSRHTTAFSYHGLKTKFTKDKTAQGMYRNNSLNL